MSRHAASQLDARTERIAVVEPTNENLLPKWFLPGLFGALALAAIVAVVVALGASGSSGGIYQAGSPSAPLSTTTSAASPSPVLSPAEVKYLAQIEQNTHLLGAAPLTEEDRGVWLQAGESACVKGGLADQLVPDLINHYGPVIAAPFMSEERGDQFSAGVVGASRAISAADNALCPPS